MLIWAISLAFIALVFANARRSTISARPRPRRVADLRNAAWFTAAALFCLPLGFAPNGQTASGVGFAWAGGVLVFVIAAWLLGRVARLPGLNLYRSAAHALRWSIVRWARHRGHTLQLGWSSFWTTVAPTGWGEIRFRRLSFDILLSFRLVVAAYGIVLVLGPIALAALLLGQFGADQMPLSVMPAAGSYLALLVATCWTVALLATVAFLAICKFFDIVEWPLRVLGIFTTIASASGIGLAVGAITASLLPALATLPLFTANVGGALPIDGASPNLLLAATGGGGVLGFLVGEIFALASLSIRAKNLVFGSIVAPGLFAVIAVSLSATGLNPATVLLRISELFRGRVQEVDSNTSPEAAGELFEREWRSLVLFLNDYASDMYPDHAAFTIMTIIATAACSTVVFVRELYRRRTEASIADDAVCSSATTSTQSVGN